MRPLCTAALAGIVVVAQHDNLVRAEYPLGSLVYINFHTVQFGGGEIRGNITAPNT
jgi:hypothetical protein